MQNRGLSFLRTRRGNAAIEFALTVPIMLLFMAGIVEFGRAFQAYGAVNRLATRYAIAWADCNDDPAGTCNTELAMYTAPAAINNFVPQLSPTPSPRMFEVKMSGTTPTIIYVSPSGATMTAAETSAAIATIASGQYGVVVTVNYTYSSIFFAKLVPSFLANRGITYTIAQLKS